MEEYNLALSFPKLAIEWNTDKNEGHSLTEYTRGSSKKVWWKCSTCGNEWQATIGHRTSGRGCPDCAKRSRAEKLAKKNLIPGKTDLATCHPDIAHQWHLEKNGKLLPTDVTPSSGKKVWWTCSLGHDFQMVIANRTQQLQGCPICGGKQILEGFNDLKSQYPEIAAQWDFDKNERGPETYAAHTNKKVFWLCEKQHSYFAAISERTNSSRRGTGCPYCAGKKVLPGFNDLATTRPELVALWDFEANKGLSPMDVVEFSLKGVHWVCRYGHKSIASVASRSRGNGCPVCANKQLLRGYNDLKTLFPHVAETWDYEKNETRPEDHIAGTHKKAWWKCPDCGNRWEAPIKERTYGKTDCPQCTFYHKTSFPEQAIFFYIRELFPDAVNSYKADNIAPYEIDIFIPSLNFGIEYDGKLWHKDVARDQAKSDKVRENGITLLRMREHGLPAAPEGDLVVACEPFRDERQQLTAGLQQLFQKIGEITGIEFSFDIDVERDFSAIKASYEGTKRQRSLAYANPEILTEWHYEKNGDLTPDKVTPHSHAIIWWKCSRCEKEWQQMVRTKLRGGLLCESCSKSDANLEKMKERALSNETKAVADFPLLLQEWDFEANINLHPEHVTYGSERKVHWVCQTCGNRFSMRIKARTTQGQGCPVCGRKKSAITRSNNAKEHK